MQTVFEGGTAPITRRSIWFKRKFTVSFLAIVVAVGLLGGVSARVLAAATTPPTDLVATAGDTQVSLSWTAPVDAGDPPVTDYVVEYSTSGANTWQIFADGTSTNTTAMVTDLTNNTAYDFRVSAVNDDGQSDPSDIATATPVSPLSGAPTALAATSSSGQVNLSWTAPGYTGTSAIIDYVVQYQTSTGGTWTTFADGTSTAANAVVTGLTNGTSYDFRVAAVNNTGQGDYSATATAIPLGAPGAPTIGTATRGDSSATVTFTAPADNGGSAITNYVVTSSPGGKTGTGTTSSITITGLTNGTAYTFTVHAVNSVGSGPESGSSNSVTPAGLPGAPTAVSGTPHNGSVSVAFTAPSANGSAITSYTVTSNPGGVTQSGATSPITVNGLTNGTAYTFTVTATNGVGTGAASTASPAVTPYTVPNAPTAVSAVASNAQAVVSFTAPAFNGGSAITGYVVTSSPGNITVSGPSSPLTVTGLTNGTVYTFTVHATNAAGNSVESSASAGVTPLTVPGAPTIGTATAGNASATVTFTAPASNGGATITSYTVTSNPGNITKSGASSPLTVTGLTNGTAYTFTVTATNSVGTGAASNASNSVTPATVPGAPTGLLTTPNNNQVGLTWTAPTVTGGSPITDYVVEYSLSGANSWTTFADGTSTTTSAAVTGLTNGTAYDFRVSAVNAVGTGTPSSPAADTPLTVPGAPTIGTVTPGNASVSVAFVAPANNGGSAVTGYTVTSSPGGKTGTGTTSPITVTGLTNGTAYTFTVTATNAAGTGAASAASASVTPRTVPAAPTAVSAVRGNGQATVSFTAPTDNGGAAITSYTVTSSPGNLTASGASSPLTVTGLTNGTAYTFTVVATNAAGNSAASSPSSSVIPATVPGAPTIGTVTPSNGSVSVAFTPPADNGGSAITSYTVTSSPGGKTGTGATSPITVTDLTNGTAYTFTVTATNGVGTSAPSGASASVTPRTVPDAPTGVTAVRGNAQATVSFTAPMNNGGSAITSYTVTSNPGGKTASGVSSPLTVTGLTNGTAYTFTVTATNVAGTSVSSTPSASITPATIPGASTSLVATPGNTLMNLAWTAPASNGGSSITDYIVEYSLSGANTWTVFSDGTSTTTSAAVTGLTNGTAYDFRVSAVNALGTGAVSASATSTPRTTPSVPTGLTATYGNAQVSLSWTTPADNGGSGITDYVVEYSLSGANSWTTFADGVSTTTSATVTDLANGTAYDFRVRAVNAAGSSSPSATASATPVLPTTVISAVAANPTDSSIVFTWTTDLGASSQVEYGPDTSYGNLTPVTDTTGTRPTSHSVTVSLLEPCVTYNYRVISQPAAGGVTTSDNYTVTTTGCPGGLVPVGEEIASVPTSGGEVALDSSVVDGASMSVSAPASYTTSPTVIQIKQFGGLPESTTGTPNTSLIAIGSQVYDIKAVASSGDLVTDFDQPITITLHYTDAEIAGLAESSLVLYNWHNGEWQPLSGSTVNEATNTITGTTTQFSLFALFGVVKSSAITTTTVTEPSTSTGSHNSDSVSSDDTTQTTPTTTSDATTSDDTDVDNPGTKTDTGNTQRADSGHAAVWLWVVIAAVVIIVIIWIIVATKRHKRS